MELYYTRRMPHLQVSWQALITILCEMIEWLRKTTIIIVIKATKFQSEKYSPSKIFLLTIQEDENILP